MEEKKKGFAKKFGITAAVLVVALGFGLGAYFAVSNNSKETAGITTNPPHEQQDPTTPIEPDEPVKEPGTPIEEPDEQPVEEPDPTPELEPDPEEPIDEPDTPIEEPDEPEPDEPPVEEQAREDMIFFDDTGELNTEGFHKALMYIMENYEFSGMTLNEMLYERRYSDYDFFAVNWNEKDNTIYMFSDCDLKSSKNGNKKEINITKILDVNLKKDYENSLENFVYECMNEDRLPVTNFYTLAYNSTEDELKRLDDYYEKAYEMSEYRVKQDLGKNDVVLGSFIEERKSMPAGLGIGNNNAITVHYWVLNEKTNEVREVTNAIHSSSVLGEGFVKNLMASPITGSEFVVVGSVEEKDVVTIDKDTLYNVENGRVMSAMRSVDYENYDIVVDEKLREL